MIYWTQAGTPLNRWVSAPIVGIGLALWLKYAWGSHFPTIVTVLGALFVGFSIPIPVFLVLRSFGMIRQ